MVDGLWAGYTSLTKDFSTQIYRMQLLGFNAIRLPFSFKDLALPAGRTDYAWCREASADDIRRSVTPPPGSGGGGDAARGKPLPPPALPLLVGGGRCNIGMPSNVFDRFLWVVNYCARAGMAVVIDNHVWLEDPTAYENPKLWVESWAKLAAAIAKDPASRGAVMYDLVNEPDNRGIFWRAKGGRPALASLYLDAMDAVARVHPSAVFVLEGTGQIAYAVPSGDGFVTDPAVIAALSGTTMKTTRYTATGIEDPSFFFEALLRKPYAQSVVFGPHFYAQSVIPFALPAKLMAPPGLYKRLDDSFGYLTTRGFCGGGGGGGGSRRCLTWPVLIGEFSAPNPGAPGDRATMEGFVEYVNNAGAARDASRGAISWFYWAWNNNSPDTNGGIVNEDWATIGEL